MHKSRQVQRPNMVSKHSTGRLSAVQGKGMEHPETMITITHTQKWHITHTHARKRDQIPKLCYEAVRK